jgi:hypothetical protein
MADNLPSFDQLSVDSLQPLVDAVGKKKEKPKEDAGVKVAKAVTKEKEKLDSVIQAAHDREKENRAEMETGVKRDAILCIDSLKSKYKLTTVKILKQTEDIAAILIVLKDIEKAVALIRGEEIWLSVLKAGATMLSKAAVEWGGCSPSLQEEICEDPQMKEYMRDLCVKYAHWLKEFPPEKMAFFRAAHLLVLNKMKNSEHARAYMEAMEQHMLVPQDVASAGEGL